MTRKRIVPSGGSREERQALRRRLGALVDLSIQPRTRTRYQDSLQWAFRHLALWQRAIPGDVIEFDALVSELIEFAWEEGEPLSLVGDLLSGITNPSTGIPALRGQLRRSWALYGVWNRQEMPSRAWPLTVPQMLALASWMSANGAQDVALLIMLGYHCLLRTGELLAVKARQIELSGMYVRGHLTLPDSKTAARSGNPEGVTITWPFLIHLLRQALPRLHPTDTLLRRSQCSFRKFFADGVLALGLVGHFKPYSLRRGGATKHFMDSGAFDPTCERGRWGSLRVARVYISTARADQSLQAQPAAVERNILHFTRHLPPEAFHVFQE